MLISLFVFCTGSGLQERGFRIDQIVMSANLTLKNRITVNAFMQMLLFYNISFLFEF